MVNCFVFGCNHHSKKNDCSFFRFPAKKRTRWESLCRRQDRRPRTQNDRICSCHFKDGSKGQTPMYFPHNEGKLFEFEQIKPKRKRKPVATVSASEVAACTSTSEVELTDGGDHVADIHIDSCTTIQEEHLYARKCSGTCKEIEDRMKLEIMSLKSTVDLLEREIAKLTVQKRRFSISSIKDSEDKMLMYCCIPYDVFQVLVDTLSRFTLIYYRGWTPSVISLEDQLLLTLMKLTIN